VPEGPEIRREADRLARVLVDARLERVWFRFPRLQARAEELLPRRIVAVRSWGKALLTSFDDGRAIYSHNQLYGRWYVVRAGAEPATNRDLRLALETATHRALLYSASEIDLLEPGAWQAHPFLAKLGPDVFDAATTPAFLRRRMCSKPFARRPLGRLLMDQTFLAGLGNYLRTEILFAARLHHALRPADLREEQLGELSRQIRRLAQRAYVTKGETATRDFVRARRRQGLPRRASRHWIFEREEEPCPACATPIRRETVDGRRLYVCPSCQPAPARRSAA
jgi:endonuclease-8